jgi:hypothetical protein
MTSQEFLSQPVDDRVADYRRWADEVRLTDPKLADLYENTAFELEACRG